MQALQRVHRSRSIGLALVQLDLERAEPAGEARQRCRRAPAIARSCGTLPPARDSSTRDVELVGEHARRALRRASAAPITSTRPADR